LLYYTVDKFTCKNCGEECESNYCPNCGQRQNIKITLRYLIRVFLNAVELKDGLIYNIKVLFLNPGSAVRDYLSGKTKPFLNPITFLIITFSIYTLSRSLYVETDTSFIREFLYQIKMSIIMMLIFSLSNYIIFTFKIYKFIEHITSIFFASFIFIILTILEILNFYVGLSDYVFMPILIISICYMFFSFQSVLGRTLVLRIFSLLGSFIIAALCFWALLEGLNYIERMILIKIN